MFKRKEYSQLLKFPALIAAVISFGIVERGTKTSGFSGHAGRPGLRGGSAKSKLVVTAGKFDLNNYKDELGRLWVDWEGQKGEKIVFITKDSKFISVSTQGTTVEVGLKKMDDILRDHEIDWSDLKTIVHNHNRGEGVSNEDRASAKAMWKAGFGGEFQIYTPKTKRLSIVRVKEMYGESKNFLRR